VILEWYRMICPPDSLAWPTQFRNTGTGDRRAVPWQEEVTYSSTSGSEFELLTNCGDGFRFPLAEIF